MLLVLQTAAAASNVSWLCFGFGFFSLSYYEKMSCLSW